MHRVRKSEQLCELVEGKEKRWLNVMKCPAQFAFFASSGVDEGTEEEAIAYPFAAEVNFRERLKCYYEELK